MGKTRFMRDILQNSTCRQFGHSWHVTVRNGRLVECCSACGAIPADKAGN